MFDETPAIVEPWVMSYQAAPYDYVISQGCHGQGKMSGKWKFFQVREKWEFWFQSGKFRKNEKKVCE